MREYEAAPDTEVSISSQDAYIDQDDYHGDSRRGPKDARAVTSKYSSNQASNSQQSTGQQNTTPNSAMETVMSTRPNWSYGDHPPACTCVECVEQTAKPNVAPESAQVTNQQNTTSDSGQSDVQPNVVTHSEQRRSTTIAKFSLALASMVIGAAISIFIVYDMLPYSTQIWIHGIY